jgi:hypothetical protein
MKRLFPLLLLAGLLTTAGPAVALAAPLRPLTGAVDGFVTDGVRYAAWGRFGTPTLTVLDTKTGARRVVGKPRGCAPWGDPGQTPTAPRLQLECINQPGLSIDVTTGAATPTPLPAYGASHRALPTCDPLTLLAKRALLGRFAADFDATAVLRPGPPVVLYRCGEPPLRLAESPFGDGAFGGHPQVSAGWATWDTGWEAEYWWADDGYPPPRARIHAFAVRSGHGLAWDAPRPRTDACGDVIRAAFGRTEHTRYRLFWVATVATELGQTCEDSVYRVFSAPLPATR